MKDNEPKITYRVSYINTFFETYDPELKKTNQTYIKVTRDFERFDQAKTYMTAAKQDRKGKDFIIEKVTTSYEILVWG
jgi:hypothetical protein